MHPESDQKVTGEWSCGQLCYPNSWEEGEGGGGECLEAGGRQKEQENTFYFSQKMFVKMLLCWTVSKLKA